MASLFRTSREHRSDAIHVVARPRQKAAQPCGNACPLGTSPVDGLACSPAESFLSTGQRTSIDSNFSDLTLSNSLDLHPHFHASTPPNPSACSLVRQPLPDEHASFLRKTLKKLRPGQQLQARKVRHLGRGGVGEVHLLELDLPNGGQLQLAQKAIVCRRYNAARHAREVAAMEIAAACPFVLRVYGSSHPGKAPYALYTEFAPLGSLHDLIEARRAAGGGPGGGRAPYFDEGEVRWLAARVLVALTHIHNLGMVHRDVSPHNIYRSASGHPLLADFDAAELLDEQGLAYGPAGRLATAAPEVRAAAYDGGSYGTKADMWGLGAVMLEMVSDQQLADGPRLERCSEELRNLLLEGLLVHQGKRLDSPAAMQHPFFAGIDWQTLEFEEAPPGLRPEGL
ncbi:hypothetical protein PLESTB_000990500 [Pleodorina starrii]|uniref:Protein kinase domain-containing protein n=1 Tax=Pleodorina starrii TaxID=330485 RepID=A0A9W6F432_9CHLO|nr:hypothetical protein PLESTM_000553300 [Pleodorina starrii]GLC55469.1 hypothetical protein PLESTB_000990500 [Pleodorina starrii]GLC73862.1 hypothetical protein PLESTF_001429000 [Pleodorina starrii]